MIWIGDEKNLVFNEGEFFDIWESILFIECQKSWSILKFKCTFTFWKTSDLWMTSEKKKWQFKRKTKYYQNNFELWTWTKVERKREWEEKKIKTLFLYNGGN